MKTEARNALIPSATVVLVRPFDGRFQVYLTRRSRDSGFMGGLFVFPGGILDPADRDSAFWVRHVDLPSGWIDHRLGGGLPAEEAMAYGMAAIRETAEESGVLLASDNGVSNGSVKRFLRPLPEDDRGGAWLADETRKHGWTLALSSLFRWARWITPVGMKKRFDTRFFLAVLPEGQRCSPDQRETVDGIWATPEQGLADNLEGTAPLSPPTIVTLQQLLAFGRLSDLLGEVRSRWWGDPIRPRMVELERGAVIVEPWDSMYEKERIDIDPAELETQVAAAGQPFSRIWLHRGRCLPLAPQ